jgi:hypothetical protein
MPCTCGKRGTRPPCPTCRGWHQLLSRREAMVPAKPPPEPTTAELLDGLSRRYRLDGDEPPAIQPAPADDIRRAAQDIRRRGNFDAWVRKGSKT